MDKDPKVILSQFLNTCELPETDARITDFNMIIFGGTGDLAKRKLLPAIYHLFQTKSLPENFSIIAFARSHIETDEYRSEIKAAIANFLRRDIFEERTWDDFARHLHFFSGQYDRPQSYRELAKNISEINGGQSPTCAAIAYLATPPGVSRLIIETLGESGINEKKSFCRLIVEKPFGRDQASAKKLNRLISRVFNENQVYRIDHYLGKETVQNIIVLRFANGIFEPLWNNRYIDHVQITVAESLGIGSRGAYFEEAGIARDMVQNHLLQLLALVAMEPPIGFLADFIRDEKVKVFRSIRPIKPEQVGELTGRGQYGEGENGNETARAYRAEDKVSPLSEVETFAALKFHIDNWRWAGTPFYLRTGKRLKKGVSEIAIQFKQPPLRLFGRTCEQHEPNCLLIRIQPDEGIDLRIGVKQPGTSMKIRTTNMIFNYKDAFTIKNLSPYERLLLDCMAGDQTLFVRQDAVEIMWSIVDPVIEGWRRQPPPEFPNYDSFSWGPRSAEDFIRRDGRNWLLCDSD